MTIGARIVAVRMTRGMAAVTLAERIGIDKAQVSRWENDHQMPDLYNLKRICDALNASADYIIGRTEKP